MKDINITDIDFNFSSLSDQVYRHIKRMILSQEIRCGEKIPEETIAKTFGVSRTPIREALRKLEKNGLIIIHPRKYAEVVRVSKQDKLHIGQIRISLDSLSVELVSKSATQEDCDAIMQYAKKCEEFAKKGETASCFEMDSLFHCEIAKRSGNKYLYELTKTIDLKVQLIRNIEIFNDEITRKRVSLHVPLAKAICEHDTKSALKIIKEHLTKYYFESN